MEFKIGQLLESKHAMLKDRYYQITNVHGNNHYDIAIYNSITEEYITHMSNYNIKDNFRLNIREIDKEFNKELKDLIDG